MTEILDVVTSCGEGRWHIDRTDGRPRAQLLLGHGAGGGFDAHDLSVLAFHLPEVGVEVARFEQPWRVAGRKVAGGPKTLDAAWTESLGAVARAGLTPVVGGRSAGARVACRTAPLVGALGVLALAFPLHAPGRPDKSRAHELPDLPLLVVQGSRDPFGSAEELAPQLGQDQEVLEIVGGNHSLRAGRSGPLTQPEVDELLVTGVGRWLRARARAAA